MAKDPFKKITNFFKKIGDFFKKIGDSLKKIGLFFKFLGDVFKSIFSYITCGFKMILTIPQCMKWYSLDILGKTVYSPIAFMFFITGLGAIEKMIWDIVGQIDCAIYSITGFHIAAYPDEVNKTCYSCKIIPIPKFPKF